MNGDNDMRCFLAIGAALALVACSSAPPPPPTTSCPPTTPLWTMAPGSWTEYQILRGTGAFVPATGEIKVNAASLVAGEIDRITLLPSPMPDGPAIARVYSPQGVTVTAVPAGLVGVLVERNDCYATGEAGNAGATDQNPPEPLISDAPFPGEAFTTVSTITWSSGANPSPFVTEYRTLQVGADIDGFTNATETSLVENPGKSGQQWGYVQVFDGGADMAEQWAGQVMPDNSVSVIMGRRVATGRNP